MSGYQEDDSIHQLFTREKYKEFECLSPIRLPTYCKFLSGPRGQRRVRVTESGMETTTEEEITDFFPIIRLTWCRTNVLVETAAKSTLTVSTVPSTIPVEFVATVGSGKGGVKFCFSKLHPFILKTADVESLKFANSE